MLAATKFLFDRRFGADDEGIAGAADMAQPAAGPSTSKASPEGEAAPQFTQEDLERVRAETLAFARKQTEAQVARMADAAEERIARALESIADRMPDLVRARHEADAGQARQAANVAMAALDKLFPNLNERSGADEILALIDTVMARIVEAPSLTVRVSAGLSEPVARRVEAIAQEHGFAGQVTVVGDEAIVDGDCRLAWASGGAVRSVAEIRAAIDEAVDRAVGPEDGGVDEDADRGADGQADGGVGGTLLTDAAAHDPTEDQAGDRSPAKPQA